VPLRRQTPTQAGAQFAAAITPNPGGTPPQPGRLEQYFDANTTGPGLWKWRHYFPVYERHFGRFVGASPRIAEIGIFSGGSLRMWREYFGPRTHIYGLDLEPACRMYEDDDTTVFIGDQADRDFLQNVVSQTPDGFDIIVDDGGHEAHQQIATLEVLLPHLRPGGVYLCEDVHNPGHAFWKYVAGFSSQLHELTPGSHDFAANRIQATIESVSIYPYVVVIEKRAAALERIEAPRHGTEWQPFYEPGHTTPKRIGSLAPKGRQPRPDADR
jgi:SAM-dependent methyltransferase